MLAWYKQLQTLTQCELKQVLRAEKVVTSYLFLLFLFIKSFYVTLLKSAKETEEPHGKFTLVYLSQSLKYSFHKAMKLYYMFTLAEYLLMLLPDKYFV